MTLPQDSVAPATQQTDLLATVQALTQRPAFAIRFDFEMGHSSLHERVGSVSLTGTCGQYHRAVSIESGLMACVDEASGALTALIRDLGADREHVHLFG